jgi:hypothetical protein
MKNSGYYPLFTCYFINLTFSLVKTIMNFIKESITTEIPLN